MTVWTIGHSTRSMEDFVQLLKENGIQVVADVRRFPGSRRHPQFGKEQLAESLRQVGIEYMQMPELGGRRPALPNSQNTAWRNAAFRGYADYMETLAFTEASKSLTDLAKRKPLAIMCAEALWWQCHRGLISDYLKVHGWKVLHIISSGKVEEHPYTSAAALVGDKLSYRAEESAQGELRGLKL